MEIKKKISGKLVRLAVPLAFVAGMFPRCANVMAPQGGPRDTLPPVVVDMRPAFGTLNFDAKRVYIEFDEYVKLADLQKEFFTSPFMTKKPVVTVRGRGIQIDIQDTLRENQTYSLNFGSSLQDNNEGNPLHGLRYVFSTGDEIDSMLMSGYTVDGYTKDSVSKSFIFFYEAWRDSIPEYDSVIFNQVPDVIGRANANGIFIAENLKPVDYRVYAMQDNNSNQMYEPGTDRIGFLDTVYNPLHMPAFDIWYDTTRLYLVADPQLYIRMFTDDPFKRQLLSGHNRPQQHLIVLNFGAPYPQIESLEFYDIDTTRIIREYLKPQMDSIAYWLDIPAAELPDTIRGQIIYMRHDSINELTLDTASLNLSWKLVESKQQERERERKEKEREEAIAAGEEVEKEPNPFNVRVEGGSTVNPEKNVGFTFDYPLVEVDSARISLWTVTASDDGEELAAVRKHFVRDTFNMRKWYLKSEWITGQKYRLEIPEGVLRNVAGEINDTLRSDFTIMEPDKYATIKLNITGKTPESEYVLQLLGQSGNLLNEKRHAVTGTYYFNYIDPGVVKIRVIEDINRSGEWDKGNLVERRQSERVEIFITESGDDEITTKMNWELEFDLDMNVLFGPVTMQKVMEQIRRTEQIRINKMMKEREKTQFSVPQRGGRTVQESGRNNQTGNTGNTGFGNTGNTGYGNTGNTMGSVGSAMGNIRR